MEFTSTPERDALRAAVRAFCDKRSDEPAVRTVMESASGVDPAVWRALAVDLGAVGLWVPPAYGGAGATFADVAVVLEEAGRSLLCAPYLSTAVLAAHALAGVEHPRTGEWLSRLAAGELIATVALPEPGAAPVTASRGPDGGCLLTGTLPRVLDGHLADLVVLPADLDGVEVLAAVPGEGLRRRPLTTMDQTRRLADLTLADAPGTVLAAGRPARELLDRLHAVARVALAVESVGGAQRCVELTAAYANTREQFGVPIGTFQAVKHRCADMLVAVELARSAAGYAAWCVDERPEDLAVAAPMAKSLCTETYRSVTADMIQLHGGIGFTWEHPAHLYYKRAKSAELLFGQPSAQRAALAGALGL